MPRLSIIVPIFNAGKYVDDCLHHCLECIENQTYRNMEIVLVDDGSTDASGQLCDTYAEKDSRCRVIHQQNRGLWAARNTGQEAASLCKSIVQNTEGSYRHCSGIFFRKRDSSSLRSVIPG